MLHFKFELAFNGQERTLILMAGLHNKADQPQTALDLLSKALSISEKISDLKGQSLAFNEMGNTQRSLGNDAEALKSYRTALALRKQIGDRAGEVETLSNIAAFSAQQQQPEIAVAFYKEAINQIEGIRKELRTLTLAEQKAYADTVAHVYRSLADLLLSQDRILEAQQVLELLKVQELRNFTREPRSNLQSQDVVVAYEPLPIVVETYNSRRKTRSNVQSQGVATTNSESMVVEIHNSLIKFGTDVKQCEVVRRPLLSQKLDQLEAINAQFDQTVQALETEIRTRRAQDFEFFDPNKLVQKAEAIFAAQPNTVIVYPLVLEDKLWVL